jgi:hypothetical protein
MLKIIFWILLIYLIYRFLSNILSPMIKSANRQKEVKREGETTVYKRPGDPSKDRDDGEYIDYHEIKD